jgi:ParB-like chromosome segregation protein Spo0J
MVDIATLKPHPANPNTHPEKQIDLLAKIIHHQGWRSPITISNRSGFIVRGHARRLAALKLSIKNVPIDYQDYTTEQDELADLVADNKITELSEFDFSIAADLLSDNFSDGKFDIELTGFEDEEIKRITEFIPDVADIDDLLNDLDINNAIEKPIWAVIRGGHDKIAIVEKALEILESEGIKVDRSYDKKTMEAS